ncbi:hypothetical protein ACVWW4_000080 [Bradyrhizobium sp. LB7.1]
MREPQKEGPCPVQIADNAPVSPYQQGGRLPSDWGAAFDRNRWPSSVGIGGRFASDSACWAWILNPAASVRFLKEFLLAAPADKIFTFGGDYTAIEPIYGHALIARRGIAQALSELVTQGWIAREETPDLIELIMRGNALHFFPNGQREPDCPSADRTVVTASSEAEPTVRRVGG